MAGYLSVIAVLVRGSGPLEGAATLALALGGVTLLLFVAHRWSDPLSELVFSRSDQTLVLTVLGITFALAGIAGEVGVSAAVVAFILGLVLSGPAADRAHDLLSPMRDLFAAVFFVFFGLSIDPGTIPPIIGVALALALVTSGTKLFTGWWSAKREGVGTRGRFRAGTALIARGEFSIAIAGIAAAGGLDPDLPALAGVYVLLVAVAGPVAARVIDPITLAAQDRASRRVEP